MQVQSLIFTQEYYLVFTHGVTGWLTRWLKPNFSHMYVVTRDEYNWLLLNPTRGYLQYRLLPIPITQSPLPYLVKPGDTVLRIVFGVRNDMRWFGFVGLLNCVTLAKYMLGIRINCLTPFGLYKRLVNFKPIDRTQHAIISLKEIHNDWSSNAMESQT